jgi:hypothetical protein
MVYYAQVYSKRTGHWLTIGDEAHSLEQAAGYIGLYGMASDKTRIVIYMQGATGQELLDRLTD